MSDNIPFEIQAEIIKSLPVTSLIRFRSVSKSWKSLIDSSDFIVRYSGQHQRLLVKYKDPVDYKEKYVSIADDDTFPQNKVPITLPLFDPMLENSKIIGSSRGLLFLYDDYREGREGPFSGSLRAVVWNISIRKAIAVEVPHVSAGGGIYGTALGFGVCPETNDPKIVKVTRINVWSDMERTSCIPWQVEVFTLSTGTWRSPYINLPRKSLHFDFSHVCLHGFLYWIAMDRINPDGRLMYYNLIISFDLTSEEFKEVELPDSLAHNRYNRNLSLSKLRECLVVLERGVEPNSPVFSVWMMEKGVPNLFTKIFTINTRHESIRGFRKTGEPIIEIVKDLRINGVKDSFSVYPYMESLLLLDQPDFENTTLQRSAPRPVILFL